VQRGLQNESVTHQILASSTDSDGNITVMIGLAVKINTKFIGTVVTLKLRPTQQLLWQQLCRNFTGRLIINPDTKHDIFPIDYYKLLLFMNHHNIRKIMLFATKKFVHNNTGK
jgi:hypothetical protein